MCYLHARFDFDDDLPDEPVPRSFPHLTWTVPVDVVELGASLEALDKISPQVEALRLCHRFGGGPMSTLPLEIIDLIVSMLHVSTRSEIETHWKSDFMCFQGRCTKASHFLHDDGDVERLWDDWFSDDQEDQQDEEGEGSLRPADTSIDEKREMVGDVINDNESLYYEPLLDIHHDIRDRWLNQFCLCTHKLANRSNPPTAVVLQQVG